MFGYKVYINLLLYHIGVRHILPSGIVNAKPIKECGEILVKYKNVFVRKTVADKLKVAESYLPDGYELQIFCGYRSLPEQFKNWNNGIKRLKQKHPDWSYTMIENANRKMNADPRKGYGPHQTGGAVDLTLLLKGKKIDIGGEYDSSINSKTKSKNLTRQQKNNRQILMSAMKKAGFQNYPNEWWHWSYGDRAWAAYKHKPFAIYGQI